MGEDGDRKDSAYCSLALASAHDPRTREIERGPSFWGAFPASARRRRPCDGI